MLRTCDGLESNLRHANLVESVLLYYDTYSYSKRMHVLECMRRGQGVRLGWIAFLSLVTR